MFTHTIIWGYFEVLTELGLYVSTSSSKQFYSVVNFIGPNFIYQWSFKNVWLGFCFNEGGLPKTIPPPDFDLSISTLVFHLKRNLIPIIWGFICDKPWKSFSWFRNIFCFGCPIKHIRFHLYLPVLRWILKDGWILLENNLKRILCCFLAMFGMSTAFETNTDHSSAMLLERVNLLNFKVIF